MKPDLASLIRLLLALLSAAWLAPAPALAQIAFRAAADSSTPPIAFRAATQAGVASGVTTLTISVPAGTIANDVMIAAIAVRPSGVTITAPAGWTLVGRTDQGAGNTNAQAVYRRVAGAAEPGSYTWTLGGGPTGATGGIMSFSGVDTVNPIEAAAGAATASGLTHTAPSITAIYKNTMLITTHSFSSAANWTPPGGMTEAVDVASIAVPAAGGISLEMNYAPQPADGATGTRTATASNDADTGVARSLALRPSLTIPLPAGTVANDVMVASIAVRPSTVTITPPTGWALVRRMDQGAGTTNSLAVYSKVAGASEPASYTWVTSAATGAAGGIQSFSGVDTATPIDVENGASTASSLSHSTPSITTTVANAMLVASFDFSSTATWTPPAGMTEAVDVASRGVPNVAGISVGASFAVQAAAGATGTKTATASNDADTGNAHILALRPSPAVTVEPNNAGFTTANSTLIFSHEVTNRGTITDSFNMTVLSESGWTVELLDPATGTAIATDTNGDGVWDCACTVNTGSLAAGASRSYWVRVTVPAGTPAGTTSTTFLRATSVANPAVRAEGADEITVLAGLGAVDVQPDNSGVVTAGSFVAYSHRVFNYTGVSDTFDLTVAGSQGWTTSIHADTNGDGVYTPGTDLAITNTAALASGASQLVFVRVDAPGGTPAGTTDVTILTATSRNNTNLYDSASDTTTVTAPTALDLSGGGTRMVVPGDLAVFPGTLYNLGSSASDFEFTIGPSSLLGSDGLNHPTELWIDSNGDSIFEFAAADTDGDGVWDSFGAGFNDDADLFPDVDVAAGATMAYEIRKAIDASQRVPQEFVTLTARVGLTGVGEADSVTAQWLIAAVTRASIRGLRVDPAGVVEFATGTQRRTHSFNLYEVSDEKGSDPTLLNETPIVSPRAESLAPILYRVETRPLSQPFLLIEEIETTGKRLSKGPFSISDEKLLRSLGRIEERMNRAGAASGNVRELRAPRQRQREQRARVERPRRTRAREGVRIEVADAGLVVVPLSELQAEGLPASAGGRSLRLINQGRSVPFSLVSDPVRGQSLQFNAEELATDYTGSNVYLLTWGPRPFPMQVPLTRSADPLLPGFVRIERTFTYVASAPEGADPFLWDILYSDGTSWPYAWWDPTGEFGRFDLPNLVRASGPVAVRLRVVGFSDHRHTVEARLNGFSVGGLTFDGAVGATLEGSVPAELLRATGNQLTLVYTATLPGGSETTLDGAVYLDYLDLAAPVAPAPRTASVVALTPYDASLPAFRRVEYLVVTHPDFRDAADRIAALKEAEGLNAAVVETDNAYDRWSGGIVEARAIQALIREAASKSGRLKYVLLVGDDTFDPLDFSGFGAQIFVPSLLSRDSGFGRIPSENLYADLNGDGSPELAMGRLPVQTSDEANAMADKIANQLALLQAQPSRHIFAVDNPRADDAPFRAEAEEMAALIGATPDATTWSDIAQGTAAARDALLDAWQSGARVTHYFGHAGPEIWADEHLLTVEDVQSLGEALKPTLVLTWACESQWYFNLWGPSLGEALFLVPNGGAVASFGPAGIAPPAKHRALYERVYGSLWSDQTLGEILRRAKADALAEKPGNREVIDGFNLIGDPALRLPARP